MNKKNKHIKSVVNNATKLLIVLCGIFMFIHTAPVQAQVLNNKGAVIFVESGVVVQGDTLENTSGTIENEGIIELNGHYLNADSTKGNGTYNIMGNWINNGNFISNSSTVNFIGTQLQQVNTGGDLFNNLGIRNTGTSIATNRIILLSNVAILNSFNFEEGNIETGDSIIYLVNAVPTALNYLSNSGSRVIGYFERGVNTPTATYLFPVGSFDHYNPLNLYMHDLSSIGSVLSQFVASDPDSIGLPLPDPGYLNPADTVEVYTADTTGYWGLTAKNTFLTNDYDINLSGSGFKTPYQNVTRIVKRDTGGNWTLDGTHRDGQDSVIYRDNLGTGISNSGNHYGWGHVRPRIQTQPEDTAICDGESATFSIVATGRGTLTYEWEVWPLSGNWLPISDNATYANSDTDTLLILAADTSMNGYKYRVTVFDSLGNFHRSNAQATLTVHPRPEVLASPQNDTICNGETTLVTFTTTEPGTLYAVEVLYSGIITGATAYDESAALETIEDLLVNNSLYADSVVYRIIPYGPFGTHCEGPADTVVIWVEPTVEITALNDTICNGDETNIVVLSDNITTNGIHYTWTATATDSDVSGYTDNNIGQDISVPITETLINTGLDSAIVHYTITPWTLDANGDLKCQGVPINIDIWVEPTVEITAAHDTICDGQATNILVTSTNTTTNGIRYTWTAVDNPNITGESNSTPEGQNIGTAIIQNLVNTTNVPQLVQYSIVPWTVNADNQNECTDINEITTVDIWVNPTPKVEVAVVRDTICNDTYTEILLTTPSVLTTGVVTFDYTSNVDAGLTGNSNDTDLTHGSIIADSLHNATAFPATPLVARYSITPRALSVSCPDGPTITDSVTVHPTPDTYMFADSVVCNGESNGRVYVIAENGINDFLYNWDDPFNHQTAYIDSVLAAGMYRVTITDNQLCTKTDSVYLGEPDVLIPYFNPDSIVDESCFGYYDGVAMVHPYGGNQQYLYEWNNGKTDYYINGLAGGDYTVTVTDWKGCTADTLIQVGPGLAISVTHNSANVRCNGENNGWIEVHAPGAISYEWITTGETTPRIENLAPNSYSVIITTGSGCKTSFTKKITEPDPLEISLDSTNIYCAGDQNGTITIDVTGGNDAFDYFYNWSTTEGTGLVVDEGNQTGLSGAMYYVTVSDILGCNVSDSIAVGEPPEFISDIISTDITCFGDSDGSIIVTAQGGNDGFTYLWSNGSTETELDGLEEGEYTVTVTDQLGCEIYDTAYITEPELLDAIVSSADVSCFGFDNGYVSMDIIGGVQPYDITWDGNPQGQSTDSIYGLTAGNYAVTVYDNNGCILYKTAEITEPDELLNNPDFVNISCFGYNNGSIVLNPTGGVQPYTYIWDHDNTLVSNSANDLSPGDYTVSVIDVNNCVTTSDISLTQPDPLLADIEVREISCNGFDDALISLTMFGGTPDYKYTWSNGYNESLLDMIGPGDYNIRVTDQLDCYIDTTISIIEPEKLVINPTIRKPTCADIQDGYIELNISGGRTPYSVYWNDGSQDENLFEIRSGIYDVLINDSSLCEIDTTFRVRSAHAFCIDIPSAFTPNGDYINEKWEIDMGGLYPQVEIEIYDRYGKLIFYSKGYEESQYWDGTYNGKELPVDAYYYIINLKNGSSRISGTVTIVR